VDRRGFLRALGMGAACGVAAPAVGSSTVRQGNRELKEMTPSEIEEILAWPEIGAKDIWTVDEYKLNAWEWAVAGFPNPPAFPTSMHPIYMAMYREGFNGGKPYITLFSRDKGWDNCIEIMMGEVWISYGCHVSSPTIVKWFLDHGFKVW
jgi:hypothetical protein